MAAATKKIQSPAAARKLRSAVAAVARGQRGRVEALESRVLFAAGDLDSTFGAGGLVTFDSLNRNEFGNAVAVQSDNKVVVAGTIATATTTGNDVIVARFNVDGSLDTTFGTGGMVVTDLGSASDAAIAVSVRADGRIVVAGSTRTGSTASTTDFALLRYNANGSLDTTFGTLGKVKTDLGTRVRDQASAMTLMPDGRIVVVGWSMVGGFDAQFAAARYNVNGTLDTSFGAGNGFVVRPYADGTSQAKSVAVLSDGSLILAGTRTNFDTFDGDFAAMHLLANGTLDTTFGVAGWASVNLLGSGDVAESVLVLGDGRLMLVGQTSTGDQQDIALVRLTSDGQLDTSFIDGAGFVVTDIAGGVDWASAALLQADGKIVVAGYGMVEGLNRFVTVRYNADGGLDTSFGGGEGFVTVPFSGGESLVEGLAMDSEQRLVVAGHVARPAGFDIAVMRLENATNQAPTALAGGPYLVNAGSVVLLDGTGSSDVDGSILSYEWDFDYDGSSFTTDATGSSVNFSAIGLTGPAVRTVALRVTDNNDATSVVATALVTINAAPTANAGGAYLVNAGDSIQLDGSGSTDVDGTVASYEWDFNYDGNSFDVDGSGVTPTFSAAGLSGGTVRTIALRVTDNHGAVSVTTSSVTINALPVGNAGGLYVVTAGGSIVLDGTGSSDADGSVASYAWDFDYDGSTFNADASGAKVTFSAAGLSGPGVRTVALRVTDNRGATHLVTTTVTINAAPVANAGGAYSVLSGQSVQLNGAGSSDADGSIVSYEWDFNYNGSAFHTDATGSKPTFSAVGVSPTVRTIALRVTDNHGATSIVTTTVTISLAPGSAMLVSDPADPGRQMLVVEGTGNGETLRLRNGNGGAIEVMLGNRSLGTFAGAARVIVNGGDGNDVLDAGDLSVPVVLFGGAGDDKLFGGTNNDILVGGAGNDQLDGGAGDDVMVGGAGRDDLDSRLGNDLLVGASLVYENNVASMSAVLAEWSRTDVSLSQRIANLMNGGGRNGSTVLFGNNIVEDGVADAFSGTEGADWLLTGPGDTVKKLKAK
jgi:uncharacterized delta-60 repeat protein